MIDFPNYENYEEGFPTREALLAYRKELLAKTAPQTQYLADAIGPLLGPVLEVGGGNGRLLVDLASKGLSSRLEGVERSRSRCEFSRSWIGDEGLTSKIRIVNGNVLDQTPTPIYDLVVCITGVFQYFEPLGVEVRNKLLAFVYDSLTMGGYFLLELYDPPPLGKSWKQLGKADQYKYILDDYEGEDWRSIKHTKTFISDFKADIRVEHLSYYTVTDILSILSEYLSIVSYKRGAWTTSHTVILCQK